MMHRKFGVLGKKTWLLVLALFLAAFCLSPLGVAAKKPAPHLPNGQPFQYLQDEIDTLQAEIDTINKQISGFQYQLLTLPNNGSGSQTIAITPTNFTIAPDGKQVRFEVSFVPTGAVPPSDSFVMAAPVHFHLQQSKIDPQLDFAPPVLAGHDSDHHLVGFIYPFI